MLRNMQEIKSYAVGATDGDFGHVNDLLFDDQSWGVRYFVVQTGSLLMSHKVLVSPYSVAGADWEHRHLALHATRQQVKSSSAFDASKPVTRRQEVCNAKHFGYPYYWAGDVVLGDSLYQPYLRPADYLAARAQAAALAADDPHLHSCKAMVGLLVHAKDGDLGHISGMLVDEEGWVIRYLVVDTSNWWMGNQVLIPPDWMTGVSWAHSKANIDLTRSTIKNSPRYESSTALNRAQEANLYDHYGRLNYWEREHAREMLSA